MEAVTPVGIGLILIFQLTQKLGADGLVSPGISAHLPTQGSNGIVSLEGLIIPPLNGGYPESDPVVFQRVAIPLFGQAGKLGLEFSLLRRIG